MHTLYQSALADLVFDITWKANNIVHHEHFFAEQFNYYRDLYPGSLPEEPVRKSLKGEPVRILLRPGDLLPAYDPSLVHDISVSQVRQDTNIKRIRPGRFYPQGMLKGLPGVFKTNMTPFLVKKLDSTMLTVDMNHPLAGVDLHLEIQSRNRSKKIGERGGMAIDWKDRIFSGPGMQAKADDDAFDFSVGSPFDRDDNNDDRAFYRTDRLGRHVDGRASEKLSQLYAPRLSNNERILDLMAGWASHLPVNKTFSSVVGLGLNAREMKDNPGLTKQVVHDLNQNPVLPFSANSFDGVICSLSVEYLTDPVSVFKEVSRVLKPNGVFCVGFSNRWFPEKAIRVWSELHEFERVGLVLRFFIGSECFSGLETFSVRGYPRPADDKYFPRLSTSDPVFMVSGRNKR